MSKQKVPSALLQGQDHQTAIDAIYYVVRVLRNSGRGYKHTPVSTEPMPQHARRLAQKMILEIESKEKRKVPDLPDELLHKYISSLENYIRSISVTRIDKSTANRATKILNEMRSTST